MNKTKQQWFFIALVYAVSNIFLLINQGIYWDDWVIYNSNYEVINNFFQRSGVAYFTPVHYFLQSTSINSALVYHIITFVLGFFSINLFYKIIKFYELNQNHIFLLTLVFAVVPYNQAKITMICLPYTIGLLMLLFGTFIFINNIKRKNIFLRVVSLITLFLSFCFINSALVMWLAFLLFHNIYLQNKIELNFSFVIKIMRRLILLFDYLLLPFFFWAIRFFFFRPTGILADQQYNEITLYRIFLLPYNMIVAFLTNTFGLIAESFYPISVGRTYGIFFILFFIFIYYLMHRLKQFHATIHISKYILFIGIYFFLAGILPYAIVGKNPDFSGFGTRGQIFLSIGIPFMIIYAISMLKNVRVGKIVYVVLISAFMVTNIDAQVKYTKSWLKQESLIQHIKEDTIFIPFNNYLVFDRTTDYNANERGMSHWALSNLIGKTLKNQSYFAIEVKDKREYRPNTEFQYYFLIKKGDTILKTKTVLLLLYQYYFDKKEYNNKIKQVLECKVLPYTAVKETE